MDPSIDTALSICPSVPAKLHCGVFKELGWGAKPQPVSGATAIHSTQRAQHTPLHPGALSGDVSSTQWKETTGENNHLLLCSPLLLNDDAKNEGAQVEEFLAYGINSVQRACQGCLLIWAQHSIDGSSVRISAGIKYRTVAVRGGMLFMFNKPKLNYSSWILYGSRNWRYAALLFKLTQCPCLLPIVTLRLNV